MPKYDNPTPVAVYLREVRHAEKAGVVIIKRPDNGGWALPAGYVETGSDVSAESAAVREFVEETGLSAWTGRLDWSAITPAGKLLLFVSSNDFARASDLAEWHPTAEAMEIRVAYEPEDLCFPLHTQALRLWFEKRARH